MTMLDQTDVQILHQRIDGVEMRLDEFDNKFDHDIDRLIKAIEGNAECIAKVGEDLKPILELQRDIIGVGRVSKKVQKIGLYIASIPVIGAALFQIYSFIVEHFKG